MQSKNYGMSFDKAFMILVTDYWPYLPDEFKSEFASARSKHFHGPGIGDKMKRRMLEASGFTGVWFPPSSEVKPSTID
jgi:hypothetical protein